VTVVATAGHVDHGKPSLVNALTGVNTDRLEEEQRRGLTIDLGFAHAVLTSSNSRAIDVSFVDVPGHVKFLRNMLAGVGGIDACLFVIDAREGWMPQSEEHFQILRLLGIGAGLIALTKSDLVDASHLDAVESLVRSRVHGTFLEEAPIVRTSIHDRASVDALARLIADIVPRDRSATVRPRMWIDRSFAPTGVGAVVTGTLLDAPLYRGAEVVILPSGLTARVRGLQSRGHDVEIGLPGTRLAVNLSGVSHHDIGRGDQLVLPRQWHVTETVDVEVHVLPGLTHELTRRGNFLFYFGSDEISGTLRLIGSGAVQPGDTGKARLYLNRSIALAPHDRFVVRETGRDETVAGGVVLDVDPMCRRARTASTLVHSPIIFDRLLTHCGQAMRFRKMAACTHPAARLHNKTQAPSLLRSPMQVSHHLIRTHSIATSCADWYNAVHWSTSTASTSRRSHSRRRTQLRVPCWPTTQVDSAQVSSARRSAPRANTRFHLPRLWTPVASRGDAATFVFPDRVCSNRLLQKVDLFAGAQFATFGFVETTPDAMVLVVPQCVLETRRNHGATRTDLLGSLLAIVAFVFRLHTDRGKEGLGRRAFAFSLPLPSQRQLARLTVFTA